MSWWVSVRDQDGNTLEVANHTEGGTYAVGGVTEADFNVTYNYSGHFHEALGIEDGLRGLDNMPVEQAEPLLVRACAVLPDEYSADYWEASAGNAGHALHILLRWVKMAIALQPNSYHVEVH